MPLFGAGELERIIRGASDNLKAALRAALNITQISERDALRGTGDDPHLWSSKRVRTNVKGTFTQEVSDDPELDTLHIRYAAIDYDQTAYNANNLAFGQMMFNNATLASADKLKIGYIKDRTIDSQLGSLGVGSKIQLWNVNTGPDYEEPDKTFEANITAVARVERTGLDEISVVELTLSANPSISVGLGANTEYWVAVSGKFKDRIVPPITDSDRGKVLGVKGDANETEFVDPATGGVTVEENRFARLAVDPAANTNIRFIVAGQGGRPALDQFPQRDGTSFLIDYRQAAGRLIVFDPSGGTGNFEINLQDLIAIRTQLIGTDLDGSTFLIANKSSRTGVFTANPAIAEVFPSASVSLPPNSLALLTMNSIGANGPSQTYELIVQPLGGQAGDEDREPLFGTAVPAGSLGVVGDAYLRTTNGQWYKKTASATWTPQVDVATQAELDAVRALIPVQHFGATVPASSLGKVGEVYFRTSTPAEIYQKTGASTWTLRLTLGGGLPTSPASGSRIGKLLQFDSDAATPVWDDRPYRDAEWTKLFEDTSGQDLQPNAGDPDGTFALSESFRNFRMLYFETDRDDNIFLYVPRVPSSVPNNYLFGGGIITNGQVLRLFLNSGTTNTSLNLTAIATGLHVFRIYGIR